MDSLKGLKHLDYAVYGNLIVPLLMFGTAEWFQIEDDADVGRCRLESRLRKKRK